MEEEKIPTQVETTKEVTGKTVGPFGGGFNHPTPKWATWVFMTEFALNKGLSIYFAATTLIPANHIKELILIMTVIDTVTWSLAHGMGVKKEDIEK